MAYSYFTFFSYFCLYLQKLLLLYMKLFYFSSWLHSTYFNKITFLLFFLHPILLCFIYQYLIFFRHFSDMDWPMDFTLSYLYLIPTKFNLVLKFTQLYLLCFFYRGLQKIVLSHSNLDIYSAYLIDSLSFCNPVFDDGDTGLKELADMLWRSPLLFLQEV